MSSILISQSVRVLDASSNTGAALFGLMAFATELLFIDYPPNTISRAFQLATNPRSRWLRFIQDYTRIILFMASVCVSHIPTNLPIHPVPQQADAYRRAGITPLEEKAEDVPQLRAILAAAIANHNNLNQPAPAVLPIRLVQAGNQQQRQPEQGQQGGAGIHQRAPVGPLGPQAPAPAQAAQNMSLRNPNPPAKNPRPRRERPRDERDDSPEQERGRRRRRRSGNYHPTRQRNDPGQKGQFRGKRGGPRDRGQGGGHLNTLDRLQAPGNESSASESPIVLSSEDDLEFKEGQL